MPDNFVPKPSAEAKAAIKAKLVERLGTRKNLQDGVKRFERGKDEPIPVEMIKAAIRATDVLVPQPLEDKVAKITKMVLEGLPPARIAEELNLPYEDVRRAVYEIQQARTHGVAKNPDIQLQVLNQHQEVLEKSRELVNMGYEVLALMKDEIMSDAADKRSGKENAKGIRPFLVQSFWMGLDAIGRHQDRIGEITGELNPKVQVNQTVTNNTQINLGSDKLNEMASALLSASGNTPIDLKKLKPEPITIDVPMTTPPTDEEEND